jgi:hypothetical protein
MELFSKLPRMTHSANYFLLLYKNKAVLNVPIAMYEVGKMPFDIKNLESIAVNNNVIELKFFIRPEVISSKNNSIKDIE